MHAEKLKRKFCRQISLKVGVAQQSKQCLGYWLIINNDSL